MSKKLRPILLISTTFLLILQIFTNATGQGVDVTITISEKTPSIAKIELRYYPTSPFANDRISLFLNDYAGVSGLASRISAVEAKGKDSGALNVKQTGPGSYSADHAAAQWSYQIDLTPRSETTAAAHISWINEDGGILMLYDLLPRMAAAKVAGMVVLYRPLKWNVVTSEHPAGPGVYPVDDLSNAVFYLNADIRWQEVAAASAVTMQTFLALDIAGHWHFTDAEAMGQAGEVFGSYNQLFELRAPRGGFHIYLGKFPNDVGYGAWEADTRDRNITILSSDMPFKSQSLQRLHEQLRHEIFHLWIPNGVNLTGNYDWFYEGFALYQSLKLGVAVNRIRFDDYLDTLSRAYDIDAVRSQKLSLIEASRNRWAGANTQVYTRGMLVAFLCDLALLERSKGKRAIANVLRELYERHRPPNPIQDGNAAVLAHLRANGELVPVIDRNIVGAEDIDWTSLLKAAGLEAETTDRLTKLKVTAKPSGRQEDLLDKLGYNNWRKLTKSK